MTSWEVFAIRCARTDNAKRSTNFIGGHSKGLQFSRVFTQRLWMVLASAPNAIIPSHDPLVTARYPAAAPGLEGIAPRLVVEPRA